MTRKGSKAIPQGPPLPESQRSTRSAGGTTIRSLGGECTAFELASHVSTLPRPRSAIRGQTSGPGAQASEFAAEFQDS